MIAPTFPLTHLFSDPFHYAYKALVERGAEPLRKDHPENAAGHDSNVQQDSFAPKAQFT